MKICILCLFSKQQIFQYQAIVDDNTWIKHCKNENIDVYKFIGDAEKNEIIDDIIYCNCEDDWGHLYEKTICALKQIDIDKYDFIVRTNLSTYINPKVLIKYCQFLKDNNYNIANGCLCLKKYIINYRGNSLIMDKNTTKYFLNNIYDNKNHIQDDHLWQEIFKNIDNLKIHSCPFRYYSKEAYFLNHPQSIKEITKENLEGIVFISYRITGADDMRYIELGRCFEIDSIYDKLENNTIADNFGLLYDCDNYLFRQNINTIIQKNNRLIYEK